MKLIQSPPSSHLLAKRDALEKAFDELALLEVDLLSNKPLKRLYGLVINVLKDYPLGLFTGIKASCKHSICLADSQVNRALYLLYYCQCNSTFFRMSSDGYVELYECLQEAFSQVLGVIEVENTRPRLYPRKGEAQPQKKEATAKKNRRKILRTIEEKK